MNKDWRKLNRKELRAPAGFFLNPTVWLFFVVLGVFYFGSYLFFIGEINQVLVIALNSICLYAIYTVTHEAIHGIAHQNKAINYTLGFICAAHEGITFPLLRLIHPQHHLYTNDPTRDPDYVIGKKPRWALPLWIFVRLTHDNWFMYKRNLWSGHTRSLIAHISTVIFQVLVVAFFIEQGFVTEIVTVWLIPLIIGGVLVEFTVAWLVHFPHDSQNTFEHTRSFPGVVWQILTLNQNYHLVHHLWPKIPWFKYQNYIEAAEVGHQEYLNNKNFK